MIERPNRAVLNDALDEFRDAMRPFIARGMRRIKGKTIENAICDSMSPKQANQFKMNLQNNGDSIEGAIDIGDFPNLISRNWGQVFSHQFRGDMNVQSLLYIITQARNKVSHPSDEDLDTEYTRVVLYHIVDVLGKVNAPEAKARVERKRDKLFEDIYPQSLTPESPEDTTHPPKTAGVKLTEWRKVIPPNLELTQDIFEEAELAANLQEVYDGRASATSYGNPVSFFEQTYMTEGMELLLKNALKRLGGRKGSPPVIQMQTGFGGGKTHSLIALYHIANSINALANIPADSDSAKTRDEIEDIIKKAQWDRSAGIQPKVAVLDGTYLSPTDTDETKEKGDPLNTLWGVMAYQLGGQEAYDLIGDAARRQDTAPLGAQLDRLFDYIGPCVILIDELVAYLVNVGENILDVNYTFIQALTESVRRSRNVVLVVTLPKSQIEVGDRGMEILTIVAKRLGRIETIWKPLEIDQAFEVVRRRLFGNKIDEDERDRTCDAFINMYNQNKKSFPQDVHNTRYRKRMEDCYPIHPEVFDRLHQDWSNIHEFQETRGVLRLMANWISRLYRREDTSPLIMPGNLPLDDPAISSEFDKLLSGRWGAVFTEADSDGGGVDLIDKSRNSFSEYGYAARRIARTVFFGSCPGRSLLGIEANRIYLGVAQPGWHKISTYTEALNEMTGSLYYFYSDENRYYFHTEENLNKVAIDRVNELGNDEINEQIVAEIDNVIMTQRSKVVICTDLDAVPDSNDLCLVILPPDKLLPTRSAESDEATPAAEHILMRYGNKERTYRNTLLFLTAKTDAIRHLRDPIAKSIAWKSITQGERRIENLEGERYKQAQASLRKAGESVRSLLPKAYRWAIAPTQLDAQRTKYSMPVVQTKILDDGDIVKSAFETFKAREDVIEYETPESLNLYLEEYIWNNNDHVSIHNLWNMMTQYVYMPRLISKGVLTDAIKEGIQSGTFGYAESYDAEQQSYQGMCFAETLPVLDMNGLIVKTEVAQRKPPLSLDSLTLVLQRTVWDDERSHIGVEAVWSMLPAHIDEKHLEREILVECIQQGVLQGVFGYAVGNTDKKVFFREALAPNTAIFEGMLIDPKKAWTKKDHQGRGATSIVARKNFEGEPSLDDINSLCQEIIAPLRADGGNITIEFTITAHKTDGFSQNIERSVKANSAELDVEVRFNNQ